MKLQELIDQTALDMTPAQVKAFFLGVLSADKPLPYPKALDELLAETLEAKKELEAPFKEVWEELKNNTKANLEKMFPEEGDINQFIEVARDQLDFFLTGLSLSGTNTESCEDEEMSEFIEELEATVEDMDDYLADSNASKEDGEDFKEFLLETWMEFSSSKQ
jgi:uncharacterized protein YgfB (UPF0149 family)